MSSAKKQLSNLPSSRDKLVDAPLRIILGIWAIIYFVLLVVFAAMFGKTIATSIATPLSGVAIFIIARWDRTRTQQDTSWREFLRHPKLSYWRIARVFIITLLLIIIEVIIYVEILEVMRPELVNSIGGCSECFIAMSKDWQIRTTTIILTLLGFFIGGYIEGKLSPYKYSSPYFHAAIGAFLLQLLHFLSIAPSTISDMWETTPVEESLGIIILANTPHALFSVFGVWVAVRKRKLVKGKSIDLLSKESSEGASTITDSTQIEEVAQQAVRPTMLKGTKSQARARKKKKHNRRR